MDTVYLETTVVGNIAGRIHPNPDVASRQHKTRHWWTTARTGYRILISQLVVDECRAGDPTAAQERLDEIDDLDCLDVTDEAQNVANALMAVGAIPDSEPRGCIACGHRRRSWDTIPCNVEFQAHSQCDSA